MNPWVIDVDHMADESRKLPCNGNAKGMVGPRSYRGDGSELEERFRMYDDDGNLYYEGRSMEVGFEPLDDFGSPNAGCTGIKFLEEGEWRWL